MRLPRLNTPQRLRAAVAFSLAAGLGVLSGCDVPSFIDPGELAGLRNNAHQPLVVQVLDDLDPALEQGNREFANAESPKAEDLQTEAADYAVGPNDLLQITVYDLEGPGLQTIKQTRVSGTGNITLPYLDNVVRAEGLTEIELQQAVKEAYRGAGVLDQANISVSVTEARNRAFSVLGSVSRPGVYVITDEDFRLLDAITQAGDVQSPFLEDLYIVRHTDTPVRAKGGGASTAPTTGPMPASGRGATTRPAKDDLAPPQSNSRRLPKPMLKSVLLQAAAADPAGAIEAPADTTAPADSAVNDDPTARVGRVDGQDVVVQPGDEAAAGATAAPTGAAAAADTRSDGMGMTAPGNGAQPFEFNELASPDNIRVIRIPLAKLRSGDLRYNVAVRPRDQIIIPPGQVGFYYMGGHVGSIGAYAFQGQKVTLSQAVISARGLDGLAIPQRTDIIRRIGSNQAMFYRVDLSGIFAGTRPDVYLKPNDQVMVGTNFLAPFLAAVRGGFRMTYGFGFLFDRNFAYDRNQQNQ